jgi:hypothetical protein
MNVEIGNEATQFPEKENINEIFIAVHGLTKVYCRTPLFNIYWSISNPNPWQPQTLTTRNFV